MKVFKTIFLVLLFMSYPLYSGTKLFFSVDQIGKSYITFDNNFLIVNNDDSTFADILYDHQKRTFYLFNKKQNTYIPFEQVDIIELKKDIMSKIDKMNQEVEAAPDSAFKNPEEAKSKKMTLFEDAFIILNTPKKDTLNSIEVNKYKVISDNIIYMDVWSAEPNKCNISKEEFEVFYSFSKLFRTYLTSVTLNMESWISPYFVDVEGIPLKTENKLSGIKSEIYKIEHPKLEKSYFVIPETYKKNDVPFRE